jgi:hypothetical protein
MFMILEYSSGHVHLKLKIFLAASFLLHLNSFRASQNLNLTWTLSYSLFDILLRDEYTALPSADQADNLDINPQHIH